MKYLFLHLFYPFLLFSLLPAMKLWANSPTTQATEKLVEKPAKKSTRRDGLAVGMFQRGLASYYAEKFHGHRTASGERFDMNAMSAAHKTLPFGTIVSVQHEETGKMVQVRINDRGPFVRDRVIDLSRRAARKLGILRAGVAPVKLVILALPEERKPIPSTGERKTTQSVGEQKSVIEDPKSTEEHESGELRKMANLEQAAPELASTAEGGVNVPFPLRRRLAIQIASYARLESAERHHRQLSRLPVHLEQHGKYYRLIIENLNPEQVTHYQGELARLGMKQVLVRQE